VRARCHRMRGSGAFIERLQTKAARCLAEAFRGIFKGQAMPQCALATPPPIAVRHLHWLREHPFAGQSLRGWAVTPGLLALIRNCQTAKAPRTPTKWPIQGKIEEISEGPLKGLRVRCWEDGNIVSLATRVPGAGAG